MNKIEKDINYLEGKWAARGLNKIISQTEYRTLKGAIIVKEALINQFENEFGFSRDMDNLDRNYSYNAGMLDELKIIHNDKQNT